MKKADEEGGGEEDASGGAAGRLLRPAAQEWAAWLASNHAASRGVWLKLAKKASGVASVTYAEALEVALAWGWNRRPEAELRRDGLAPEVHAARP